LAWAALFGQHCAAAVDAQHDPHISDLFGKPCDDTIGRQYGVCATGANLAENLPWVLQAFHIAKGARMVHRYDERFAILAENVIPTVCL
jgi:hypothetical protein